MSPWDWNGVSKGHPLSHRKREEIGVVEIRYGESRRVPGDQKDHRGNHSTAYD